MQPILQHKKHIQSGLGKDVFFCSHNTASGKTMPATAGLGSLDISGLISLFLKVFAIFACYPSFS